MPDQALFELAAARKLQDPATLTAQIERMLKDGKSREFAERFVSQWLGTRELGRDIKPDEKLFPEYYDAEIQAAIRYEPVLFFQEILAKDLSLLNLIDSKFSILTNKLSKFYGFTIKGATQQPKVLDLPEGSHRGGVLNMAAILAVSSYPQRTSPVLRGALSFLPAEPIMLLDLFKAIVLGVVEGLTEFVPVSSTGHLLLVQQFFGFDDDDFGKTFAVLIQFGAILALLSIYSFRIWQLAIGMFKDPAAQRFIIGVLIAFLPAALVGAVAHDFIKSVLFNVWIVCFTLIVGGAILLWVDQMDLDTRYHDATRFSLPMYLVIGLAQCVSMIPGVSRSGATIVSAMLLGADRRSAAEFSFWLAMPTMFGAFVYDLYKSRGQMSLDNGLLIAVGFAVSFVAAWIVVKTFLGYVQRHGFALFAWWRVVVGTVGLIALALGY